MIEHLLLFERVLPFESAIKVAAVTAFECLKGARLAHENAEPDDVVYYALRLKVC